MRPVLLLILFLAVGGGVWAGIYAQKKGFPETSRKLIEEEFAKRGYYTRIKKVTLGPLQGLVAEEVFFFQDPQRLQEIAKVDNVILDLDLTDILKGNLSINTLDFQDAKLDLPLTPGKRESEMLRVDHFSGRLVVTESQIEIVKAQANLQGIEVTLKGSLHRPALDTGDATGGGIDLEEQRSELREIGRRIDTLQAVLQEIDRIQFDPGKKPRLEIEFSGDLMDLGKLRASARLTAENFRRKSYSVDELTASMEFDGEKGRATLKELHLRDAKGDLRLWADWPVDGNKVNFDLNSTADLKALINSIYPNPNFGEVNFFHPTRVKMEGVIKLDEIESSEFPRLPVEAIGEFSTDRFGSKGEVFDGLEFNFSVSGDRYYVRNLRLDHQKGSLLADHQKGSLLANLMFDPSLGAEAFRYQSQIKLDPRVFAPFFKSPETQRFLSKWSFNRKSDIYVAALGSGPDLNPENWHSRGLVDIKILRLNNVRFNRFEANYEIGGGTHIYRRVRLARPDELLIAPEARYDADSKKWTVTGLKWSLDPIEGIRAFIPDLAEPMQQFRFSKRPEVTVTGKIDTRSDLELAGEPREHDFQLEFKSDQPAEYRILGRALPFENPEGSLRVDGETIHLSNFTAGLFGGGVKADYRRGESRKPNEYSATVSLDRVPAGKLLETYSESDSSDVEGTMTGRLELSGVSGVIRSASGTGEAALHDGDLFTIPPFGPLPKLIGEANPGGKTDGDAAPGASASLELEGGVLSIKDLKALTGAIELRGNGRVDCVEKTIRFDATAGKQGSPEDPGEWFDFTGEGSLEDPKWQRKPR